MQCKGCIKIRLQQTLNGAQHFEHNIGKRDTLTENDFHFTSHEEYNTECYAHRNNYNMHRLTRDRYDATYL